MKKKWLLALLVLIGSGVYGTYELDGLAGNVISLVDDEGSISVHFCPAEDCEQMVVDFLDGDDIRCAFYDLNLEPLKGLLRQKNAQIVIDEDNARKAQGLDIVTKSGYGLMHDKFCVVDRKKVFTGSMNPTLRDTKMNNNNLIFIESDVIASYYSDEFEELVTKTSNDKKKSSVLLDGVEVAIYFCPEDDCADKVVKELKKAEKSIHFMAFSFTHSGIANAVLLRMKEGVSVQGVYEKMQLNEYTTFDVLKEQGADVKIDGNPTNMHHKVFVIDGKTVVTGSMNPTAGGDERNDENLLIIKDEKIAQQFEEEFGKVWGEALP